jgi:hypothetical protein
VGALKEMKIPKLVTDGKRPEQLHYEPTVFPENFWTLLEYCWHCDPPKRPLMETVVRGLEDM